MATEQRCEQCKNMFIPKSHRDRISYVAKYCSVPCRIKAQRAGDIDMSQGAVKIGKYTLPAGVKKLSDAKRLWEMWGLSW